jgi:hypothetical protein
MNDCLESWWSLRNIKLSEFTCTVVLWTLSVSSNHMLLFIYCELFTVCLDTSCGSGLSMVQNVHFLHWSELTRFYIYFFLLQLLLFVIFCRLLNFVYHSTPVCCFSFPLCSGNLSFLYLVLCICEQSADNTHLPQLTWPTLLASLHVFTNLLKCSWLDHGNW